MHGQNNSKLALKIIKEKISKPARIKLQQRRKNLEKIMKDIKNFENENTEDKEFGFYNKAIFKKFDTTAREMCRIK